MFWLFMAGLVLLGAFARYARRMIAAAERAGLSPEDVDSLTEQYADAQIMAPKVAFAAIAFFSLLALWYVQTLPKRAEGAQPARSRRVHFRPLAQLGKCM